MGLRNILLPNLRVVIINYATFNFNRHMENCVAYPRINDRCCSARIFRSTVSRSAAIYYRLQAVLIAEGSEYTVREDVERTHNPHYLKRCIYAS